MFDNSTITVVGNALTTPEWRRFERTNALVANFRVASTSRRFDRQKNCWVDGDNLRVRVNCWRRLAEGVVASIRVGDPVVVTGRMYTRDWTTESGERRSAYELEAVSVGHDLSRGIAAFKRGRLNIAPSVVEDAESDKHVNGEPTSVATDENARSEAIALGMAGELRRVEGSGAEGSGALGNGILGNGALGNGALGNGAQRNGMESGGYDRPVNAHRVDLVDLGDVAATELGGDLDARIAAAQQTLGTPPPNDGTPGAAPAPDAADAPGGDDEEDEAAALTVAVPEPPRNRRIRQKAGANA